MGLFDGYFLFSDVDGTLMTSEYLVPQMNRDALVRFTREGGLFALATGRGISPSTDEMLATLPINAPCVLLNGGVIYDGASRKRLAAFYMPPTVRQMVKTLLADDPESSISVWREEARYEVGREVPGMTPSIFLNYEVLPDPWCKLVIRTTAQRQQALICYLEGIQPEGVRVVTSCDTFVEVMPASVTKASGIEYIIGQHSVKRDHILTIGDYYNDYEMLALAGARCFCPDNAPDDIKKICERCFCHVNDGAVAALIEMLEQELGG